MKTDRSDLYKRLREEFPEFTYNGFSCNLSQNELQIHFDFDLSGKYSFKPSHSILLPEDFNPEILSDSLFRNIVFNLGMAEMISYWKASCSPKVRIRKVSMEDEQLDWWKKLFLHGLGEFFYTNGIKPEDDFIEFVIEGKERLKPCKCTNDNMDSVMVPVGGGKDSVVTLELLKDTVQLRPYIINPRPASRQSVINAGIDRSQAILSRRTIDRQILALNELGFLNGHTPFSAMLAFTSFLVAHIYDIPVIALSNESSANEPTIPGTKINHQYSKSIEFENDFRQYMASYVCEGIQYLSLLRPLNELQIAALFSKFPAHFDSFRSCNVGSKTDSWCGKCPKCLFTFIILSPFIGYRKLVELFGHDLFNDDSLYGLLDQLTGMSSEKPFECIGTIDEVNAALGHFVMNADGQEYPALISHYLANGGNRTYNPEFFEKLIRQFGPHYISSPKLLEILKSAVDEL